MNDRAKKASQHRPGRGGQSEEPEPPVPANFPIVGVGCSAGGLDALEKFFSHVRSEWGMAFVVVQHLSPDYDSALPKLLQRATDIDVFEATDGTRVEPNCVYTIPPNKDLSLVGGALQLRDPVEPHGHRLAIDFFLRSLALDRRERAVGVVLSGMGSDGMFGLRAIKERNGLTLAQEPSGAFADSMPRSAISAGVADIVAPPEELPAHIAGYVNHSTHGQGAAPAATHVENDLDTVVALLRERTGNDFSLYKSNTIVRRIGRRMALHQIAESGDYVQFLRSNPQELDLLFSELLIGVTQFFRDPDVWEFLREEAIPSILAASPSGAALRAWVPACSSGEEAYSLAIVFSEAVAARERDARFTLQIYGTDLDSGAIDRARKGHYPRNIAADVSPGRLSRYFAEENGGYRVKTMIREMVVFATQNVISDPPFTKLDVLSCRNLLIYFQSKLQKKLLPLFHYALTADGLLLLGSSETVNDFGDLFTPVSSKVRVFRRRPPQPSAPPVEFPSPSPASRARLSKGAVDHGAKVGELTDRLILQRFAPPAVLVNPDGDILYISGRTGKYLEPAAGKVNVNLHAMARDGIRQALTGVLRRALLDSKPIRLNGLPVEGSTSETVDVTVQAVEEPGALRGRVLVVFEAGVKRPVSKREGGSVDAASYESLAEELRQSRDALKATQEEMQTALEEFNSTNEELQSTNEELQSANEELSTSKEELQSMNEELQTVNSELQSKVRELTWAQNDMTALLNSTEIATVFLDADMNVRRFTEHATRLFKLIDTDVGRPLSDVATVLEYPELQAHAKEVLRTLVFKEERVEANDNQCYRVRIMPYRTQANVIDGVVMTFLNITEIKELETKLTANRKGGVSE